MPPFISTTLRNKIEYAARLMLITAVMFGCQACFTGIEGTRKITLSKEDQKLLEPTEEEKYLHDITGSNIDQWSEGKQFVIADNRATQILKPIDKARPVTHIIGDTVRYSHINATKGYDGKLQYNIIFKHDDDLYRYDTSMSGFANINDITSDKLPMLIDLDLTKEVYNKIVGKHLYLLSSNWLDATGNRYPGCKYVEAVIENVTPANTAYPLLIKFFVPSENLTGYYLMNYNKDQKGARTFASLFSFNDPKRNYNYITDENWHLICHRKVNVGMTKNECRLALGSPDDSTATRDYSSTIDIWRYTDGTVLFFKDGLLTETKIAGEFQPSENI